MFDIVYLGQRGIRFIRRYPRTFTIICLLCMFGIGIWVGREVRFDKIPDYFKSYTDPVRTDETKQVFPGVVHRQILDDGVLMNVLSVSPDAVDIRPYRALSAGIGTEYLRSIAARHRAPIAINGSFFEMSGKFRGESVGALKIEGVWLSEPEQGRGVIGFRTVNGKIESYVDRIVLRYHLVLQGKPTVKIDGINRGRLRNELILYHPNFHMVTLTMPDGVEVVVRNDQVVDIRDGQGSSRIPADGYILSANGKKREMLLAQIAGGDLVKVQETVIPERVGESNLWESFSHIIGGGPLLLRQDVISTKKSYEREGFDGSFHSFPHPRTAVGRKTDGTLLFVTVTAAAPGVRRGVTLQQLAKLFQEWGATDAINLDGGSSSMMVIRNQVVSIKPKPKESDTTKGRSRRVPSEKKPETESKPTPNDDQTADKTITTSGEKQPPTTEKRTGNKSKATSTQKKTASVDRSQTEKDTSEKNRKYGRGNLRIRPMLRSQGRSISDAILIFPRDQGVPNKRDNSVE